MTDEFTIPADSTLTSEDYADFLSTAAELMRMHAPYLAPGEGVDTLELAHLIPTVPETLVALYVGINDVVCNKGLVAPFLVRHSHNTVFAFDPAMYSGGRDVPGGTIDAAEHVNGFTPPNDSWHPEWTYVMIGDPARTPENLWTERGYIDTIAAKLEDFTMLGDTGRSGVCFFINPRAFDHPVNRARPYLGEARDRGEKLAGEFIIPDALGGETEGLEPVVLRRGEKLYVATPDHTPCDHAWSNLHPDNEGYAVVNENSAVDLRLMNAKPPVAAAYAGRLRPAPGSADLTTDLFFRWREVVRRPVKTGAVGG